MSEISKNFTPPPFDVPILLESPKNCECPEIQEEETCESSFLAGCGVGFCIGVVVIVVVMAIVGLIYRQTRKGRAKITAIKTYRLKSNNDQNQANLSTVDSTDPGHSQIQRNPISCESTFETKIIELRHFKLDEEDQKK